MDAFLIVILLYDTLNFESKGIQKLKTSLFRHNSRYVSFTYFLDVQGKNGGQFMVRSHKKQIIYYTPQAIVTYYLDVFLESLQTRKQK